MLARIAGVLKAECGGARGSRAGKGKKGGWGYQPPSWSGRKQTGRNGLRRSPAPQRHWAMLWSPTLAKSVSSGVITGPKPGRQWSA